MTSYNWLVSAGVLPVALLATIVLAVLQPSKAPLASTAYVCIELLAYWIERNWSSISAFDFWAIALPVAITHCSLCWVLAPQDGLGCLILSALCLLVRETIFELCYGSEVVIGYIFLERLPNALSGGFLYGFVAALFAGVTYRMVHLTHYHAGVVSTKVAMLLFSLLLPLFRGLAHLLLLQIACSIPMVHETLDDERIFRPQVDALIMSADLTFSLTVFLEVANTFVLLLTPWNPVFYVGVGLCAERDVVLILALGVLQEQRLQLLPEIVDKPTIPAWSPTYSVVSPKPVIAATLSGALSKCPYECARLYPPPDASKNEPSSPETSWRSNVSTNTVDAMSPRVSQLLDDFNAGVNQCLEGKRGFTDTDQDGLRVYLTQERRQVILAHLLAGTLAFAIVGACIPLLHALDVIHFTVLTLPELGLRVSILVVVRTLCDGTSAWMLEKEGFKLAGILQPAPWEGWSAWQFSRCWAHHVLSGLCPLIVAMTALL